jgi:hypothetical protein
MTASCSRLGGRSPEQCVQGRWRAVATAFSGQPHEFLRSTVLAWNAMGLTGSGSRRTATKHSVLSAPGVLRLRPVVRDS